MKYIFHIIISLCLLLAGCGRNSETDRQMDRAEGLMLSAPDSSLQILDNIQAVDLSGKEQKARYALLKSMALDKNYIDTTTFDVLQPAIDYYIENGTPDEKLRTHFYQGRIFQNREEYDPAMQSFLKGIDQTNYTDTLTFANMLVAISILNYSSYQMEDYVSNNLIAADLYDKLNNNGYRQSSLIKALDGSIALADKHLADSIKLIVDSLAPFVPECQHELLLVRQTYSLMFEPDATILAMVDTIPSYSTEAAILNIATGYITLKNYKEADSILKSIDPCGLIGKSRRFLQLKTDVLEANGKYKEALAAYKTYFDAIYVENSKIFSQKTKVAEERHNEELNNLRQIQQRDKIIWLNVCSILVLLLVIGIISYFYRIGNMKRVIAENDKSRLQLENYNLQKQNSVLALEKRAAKLEAERQNLAGDNMRLRISQLEAENEQLKDLSEKEELPDDVRAVIKERIEMLNAIFAAKILDKDASTSSYDDWVRRELGDKERFMNSNRLAYKVSHPMFIKYLEEHGLTEYEINYLCLYAIGLKGKEVGSYMELRRHYNISSEIRRKLGIDEHDTNIGIYVRKLLKRF